MPSFVHTEYLITIGVIQAGLGLAIGIVLLGLFRLGRHRYLAYWALAWLIMALLNGTGALGVAVGVDRGPGLALGLLGLLLLYVQPAALALAAVSLTRPKPGPAVDRAVLGGAAGGGLTLVVVAFLLSEDPRVRSVVTVVPAYLLGAVGNGWFASAFARHHPRAASLAGRLVVGFGWLYALHLLAVGLGWAGAGLYRSPSLPAVVGMLLPMGITAGIMLSVVDDTRESAARLKESEAANRGLVQAIPDTLVVLDREGVYRDFRPARGFVPLVPPSERLGKRATDFLPAALARDHDQLLAETLRTGEPQVLEYTLPVPGGATHFEARMAPTGADRVIVIVRDVTARKRAEEERESLVAALASEKERLAVTLRSIGDGVIATDVSGRITLINRVGEELTGWPAAQADGRSLDEVFPVLDPATRRPQSDPVASVLRDGHVLAVPGGSLLRRRDGRELWIAESAAPIRDRDGGIVGVVLVFRDVTERLRLEEQVQSTQRLEALGVLAGGIAHDFNNLLFGVLGFVELARRRAGPDGPVSDALDRARDVLTRARGLTGQLLTFSRAGQPVKAPVALEGLLRASSRFALSGSNVSGEIDVPGDLWPCDGDERQIDQVVDNLLLNARQAMPQGGVVRITGANVRVPEDVELPVAPGRYVRVTVRDQGDGVPADARARIFEPFFTTKSSGSGLGLATAYSIVRKHGGHIDVASEPGRGAAFSVFLPASSGLPAGAPAGEAAAPAGEGRLLVLDDEDYVREAVQAMLESLGYEVEAVAEPEAAVESCRRALTGSRPFDLAILDLTIPGGQGGAAVAPRLHEIDPGLPIVASSGYTGDPVMADPVAHGFAGTLAKPYTLDAAATVVARLLHERRAGGRG